MQGRARGGGWWVVSKTLPDMVICMAQLFCITSGLCEIDVVNGRDMRLLLRHSTSCYPRHFLQPHVLLLLILSTSCVVPCVAVSASGKVSRTSSVVTFR